MNEIISNIGIFLKIFYILDYKNFHINIIRIHNYNYDQFLISLVNQLKI
jgi:hypothetical protein